MSLPRLVVMLAFLASLGTPAPASAQGARVVLDVPYVTQTADLCGGAAVAMVFRYWGNSSVAVRDFAPLVDASQKGIPTTELVRAVTGRGWRATLLPSEGDRAGFDGLAADVRLGRPPIALIEVAPKTYHYIVVVAVTDRDVVFHDPASRPFETMSVQRFSKAWSAAGSWAMVVLPAAETLSAKMMRTIDATIPAELPAEARCATLIAQAVANSRDGDHKSSERDLLDATARCPDSAAAWRELAGLRFVNSRWEEARVSAEKAIKLAPDDQHSWQILGASLFLQGNVLDALRAWNQSGDPRVEAILVSGANATRQPVVVDRLGLRERDLLTPSAFRRAARRAADLPSVSDAVVRFFPHDNSGASLEVDIDEARKYPWGYAALGNIVGRGIVVREVKLPFAGITGNGERIDVEYGWKRNHPAAAIRLTAPAPGAVPGLIVFEWARSRQTFAAEGLFGAGNIIEDRKGVRIGLEDWATGRIHWNVDGLYNRLEQGPFVALGGGLDTRFQDDRIAVLVDVSSWMSTSDAPGFRLGSLTAKWRQNISATVPRFMAEAGVTMASEDAPLSFWAGADVGPKYAALLRAHKLLSTGIVTSDVFGRRLAFGSVTYERPVRTFKFGTATIAAFLDSVRAWEGMVADRRVTHADIGLGLRLHAPAFGSIRVDVAWGLRDGADAVSAAFVKPWPRR